MELISITIGKKLIAMIDKSEKYIANQEAKAFGALLTDDVNTMNTELKCAHTAQLKIDWALKNCKALTGLDIDTLRKLVENDKKPKSTLMEGLEMLKKGILDLS